MIFIIGEIFTKVNELKKILLYKKDLKKILNIERIVE